ncbi:DUF6153 family protein [Couchioplanes caeruleus]|uniref:DUF6153 family protein n=1 Tax=Couchioplanes caeruleus TaxID=56438 RepID=UPI003D3158EF
MLLFCTLFGLATMHTLGHAGMQMDSHAGGPAMLVAEAGHIADGANLGSLMDTAASVPCPDDHCGDGHGTGGMDAWTVCLAVLGGLALVVLLSVLLVSRRGEAARRHDGNAQSRSAPRAPPGWRHQGLRVASLAVMRI